MLVHSAAGGGGLAAVYVARWLGTEVYATAGSRRRRDFPREREIVHVGDSRTTVTVTGARLNVLAAIEHATRRVRILDAIAHPGSAWVSQATRNLAMDLEDAGRRIRHMIRDRDGKYPGMIDAIVADAGSTVVLSGIRVPWDEFDHGALDPVLPS